MLYFLLILFFGSFLGIVFMIWRKLLLLESGQVLLNKEESFHLPSYLEDQKRGAVQGIKRYGYLALVSIIRFYFRSANLLKSKWEEVKIKVKNIHLQKNKHLGKREVSGFLKIASEYKNKIRRIKDRVKEEENL